ncbi:MAG: MogA/MoaB family molybdenum cofactor biosynthesis protein [Caldilineae bacterium]|nr:MAG: MogA/MoaB family molybdenum cofactor biosynthesis protein [Caldilineae bacterium]
MSNRIGILTVSDSAARGESEDRSGPLLLELIHGLIPDAEVRLGVVADDRGAIARRLKSWADDDDLALILTTGGTGLAPRDVTPEATLDVIERQAPGIAEAIRAAGLNTTPHAMLSRGVAGVRGRTLIINLSGSPKAVREQFDVIRPVLLHALELVRPGDAGIRHAREGEHRREA